jgi:hypothetical protein
VRPSEAAAMLIHVVAYDSQFSIFFRERHSPNLDTIFDNELKLESNMVASDMLFTSHSQSLKKGKGDQASNATLSISNHINSCLPGGLLTLPSFEEDKKPAPNFP